MNPVQRFHSFTAFRPGMTLLIWAGLALGAASWADCHDNYTQAVDLLDNATKQATANKHPNPDAFSNDFKAIVTKMQTEKCMPELMNLIQHIQAEQQKLPPPDKNPAKPAPVMD